MATEHNDFYQHLKISINYWLEQKGVNNEFAKHIKLAPELFKLTCQLSLEKSVSLEDKAKFAVAIAYFISPYDMYPEAFAGVIGYSDDIILIAFVLNSVLENISEKLINKLWKYESDLKQVVNEILLDAEEMVGAKLFLKLKALVDY